MFGIEREAEKKEIEIRDGEKDTPRRGSCSISCVRISYNSYPLPLHSDLLPL